MTESISKTKFQSGLLCHKKLWLSASGDVEKMPPGAGASLRFARGKEVDNAARQHLNVRDIVTSVEINSANQVTKEMIQASQLLGQGVFIHEGLTARLDIIRRIEENGWELIEVKMSSKLKEEHISDVAFQKFVAEKCGLIIKKCSVLHLNKDCIAPDFSNLFISNDVTQAVESYLEKLPSHLEEFDRVLKLDSAPEIRIGRHCDDQYLCEYYKHCWQDVPFHSVFTIPRVSEDNLNALLDQSILHVTEIPQGFKLPPAQQKYVELIKNGKAEIDRKTIAKTLSGLSYPIYFLDFEADMPPIPWVDGMSPYGKLPFQFSVHKLEQDGSESHFEFLHTDRSDPRGPLTDALCSCIGPTGSVVTYTTAMERACLDVLANFSSEKRAELEAIKDRIWDQSQIFSKHFLHPNFAGKYSLKVVLPIIVPSLSYDDTDVQGGEAAVAKWVKLINCTDRKEQLEIQANLRAYCKLDTLAMLEIHKYLTIL